MKKLLNNQGFTIIELMIAIVVFSSVLVMVVATLIQIGRLYTKAIYQSKTQEVARTVLEDMTRSIQLRGSALMYSTTGSIAGSKLTYCTGEIKYTVFLNVFRSSAQPGLLRGTNSDNCRTALAPSDPEAPQEMLQDGMTIKQFDIAVRGYNPGTGAYEVGYGTTQPLNDITVTVAYDTTDGDSLNVSGGRVTCKSIISNSEFCAISKLSTSVTGRLQ